MHNTSAGQDKPVTFYVYRKDGSRNPEIRNYFLEHLTLDAFSAQEGYVTLEDGSRWKLILEQPVVEALRSDAKAAHCIISYQARTNGNFAVARLFNPNYKEYKRLKRGE